MNDPGAVVLDGNVVILVADLVYADLYVRKDIGFLAGIEGVVHGLFDPHEKRFGAGIEPEDLLVLLEELRDGDLLLLGGHLLRRRGLLPLRRGRFFD